MTDRVALWEPCTDHGPGITMGEYFTHGGVNCHRCWAMLPLPQSATFPQVAPVPISNNERPIMEHELLALAAAEHRAQQEKGYTAEHDDEHTAGQLARAAACYALPWGEAMPSEWPWRDEDWHPQPDNRKAELVVAVALLVAEYDRLARLEARA